MNHQKSSDLFAKAQQVIPGGVNSPVFQMIVSNALEGDYSGLKFSLANGEKDIRYYNRMTEAAGLTNALGRNLQRWRRWANRPCPC